MSPAPNPYGFSTALRTAVLLIAALAVLACGSPERAPEEAPVPRRGAPRADRGAAPDEPVFRYDRSVRHGDTTHLFHTTPDRLLTYRYTYVARRLLRVDLYDYTGQTPENLLEFTPRRYTVPVGPLAQQPRSENPSAH